MYYPAWVKLYFILLPKNIEQSIRYPVQMHFARIPLFLQHIYYKHFTLFFFFFLLSRKIGVKGYLGQVIVKVPQVSCRLSENNKKITVLCINIGINNDITIVVAYLIDYWKEKYNRKYCVVIFERVQTFTLDLNFFFFIFVWC